MSIHTFPLDDHLVIFRPADKRLFILNQTAAWIWQAVTNGLQTDEIIELLTSHFHMSMEETERDVQTTLDQWDEQGLDPARPDKGSAGETSPPLPTAAIDSMALSVDVPISLQLHYHFGQSTFTLNDYTPDLGAHIQPLLASLATADRKNTENRIELFKDGE